MAELTESNRNERPFWALDVIVAVVLVGAAALGLAHLVDVSAPQLAADAGLGALSDSVSINAPVAPDTGWSGQADVVAAVNGVLAPAGTGLPNIKAIEFEPTQIFPVVVRLEV